MKLPYLCVRDCGSHVFTLEHAHICMSSKELATNLKTSHMFVPKFYIIFYHLFYCLLNFWENTEHIKICLSIFYPMLATNPGTHVIFVQDHGYQYTWQVSIKKGPQRPNMVRGTRLKKIMISYFSKL